MQIKENLLNIVVLTIVLHKNIDDFNCCRNVNTNSIKQNCYSIQRVNKTYKISGQTRTHAHKCINYCSVFKFCTVLTGNQAVERKNSKI